MRDPFRNNLYLPKCVYSNKNARNIGWKGKGVDEDHRDEIVNELFGKCDQDHNGKIDLDEFI